jgi:type VI secretion system secreted protein VgrG
VDLAAEPCRRLAHLPEQERRRRSFRKSFDKAGFGGQYEFGLRESYKPLEYCVQYRETHLDFVLRLMEQFGIYYCSSTNPASTP